MSFKIPLLTPQNYLSILGKLEKKLQEEKDMSVFIDKIEEGFPIEELKKIIQAKGIKVKTIIVCMTTSPHYAELLGEDYLGCQEIVVNPDANLDVIRQLAYGSKQGVLICRLNNFVYDEEFVREIKQIAADRNKLKINSSYASVAGRLAEEEAAGKGKKPKLSHDLSSEKAEQVTGSLAATQKELADAKQALAIAAATITGLQGEIRRTEVTVKEEVTKAKQALHTAEAALASEKTTNGILKGTLVSVEKYLAGGLAIFDASPAILNFPRS